MLSAREAKLHATVVTGVHRSLGIWLDWGPLCARSVLQALS